MIRWKMGNKYEVANQFSCRCLEVEFLNESKNISYIGNSWPKHNTHRRLIVQKNVHKTIKKLMDIVDFYEEMNKEYGTFVAREMLYD